MEVNQLCFVMAWCVFVMISYAFVIMCSFVGVWCTCVFCHGDMVSDVPLGVVFLLSGCGVVLSCSDVLLSSFGVLFHGIVS